jgi:hypothetical protein
MNQSYHSLDDEITYDFPSNLRPAIGDFIMTFSGLELDVQFFIWCCLNISPEQGRLITERMDARPKFEMAQKLYSNHRPREIKNYSLPPPFWKACEKITKVGNAITHGWWVMTDNVPIVLSFRLPAPRGQMGGEEMAVPTIVKATKLTVGVAERFRDMSSQFRSWHRKFSLPLPKKSGIHPTNLVRADK